MNSKRTYRTGETISKGDCVQIGEWEGTVESIITQESEEWKEYWHELGEGVMLIGPAFGRLYAKLDSEELVFIRRGKK